MSVRPVVFHCMKTTAQLTYEKVRFDEAKDVHLVVCLAAPHLDAAAPRPPVCVIPVLDVSGSMAGEKLHFAKQSIMKLVDHLAPGGVLASDDVTWNTAFDDFARHVGRSAIPIAPNMACLIR